MNKIYLTGDRHSDLNPKFYDIEFFTGDKVDETDYLIILGDFGLIWENKPNQYEYSFRSMLSKFPNKILFVDGNHENHSRLNMLKKKSMFGGIVGQYNDQIYHLKRGEIYNIYDNKIFVMGGARSVDKMYRQEFVSWWKEELPSYDEIEHGIYNLTNHKEIDYILGHTGPEKIIKEYFSQVKCPFFDNERDSTSIFFDHITDPEFGLNFKKMYFGHIHDHWSSNDKKYISLYTKIIKLGEL